MATRIKYTTLKPLFAVLLYVSGVSLVAKGDAGTRESFGLEIQCEEVRVRITVKRLFFEKRRIPFKPEYLRLGANSAQQRSCGPKEAASGSEMVISAGLRECGTESSAHGEWLVYTNQLLLFPAVVPTMTGSVIVRGATTVIPVECQYKRKQTVNGEPLTPTWLPLTSTISVFGLLHFSLRNMADDCTSLRSSSVYQQGEAVFLEASVEAPLHPPLTLYVDYCVATLKPDPLSLPSYMFITKHGCLIDSVLPGSSSKFLRREQDNRLCFSVQAFHFKHVSEEQMFISCHLRATLKQNSHSHLNKACFFHRPTFRLGCQAVAGVPQRETMLCVNAATLMTAIDRLKRRTVATLDSNLIQTQERSMKRTQQLGHFTLCHAPIGQDICQSVTKEPFPTLQSGDCQDQSQMFDNKASISVFLMTHH